MIALQEIQYEFSEWKLSIRPAGMAGISSTALELAEGVVGWELANSCNDLPNLHWVAESENFPQLRLVENCEYEFRITTPHSKEELTRLKEFSKNPIYPFSNINILKNVSFNQFEIESTHCHSIYGRIRFSHFAGKTDLSLEVDGFSCPCEVVTKKLDYEQEYMELLHQLGRYHEQIILKLDGSTEARLRTSENHCINLQTEFLHLKRLMHDNKIKNALSLILERPASRFKTVLREEETAFVAEVDVSQLASNALGYQWKKGGVLGGVFKGYTPLTLPEISTKSSVDIPENRYVKQKLTWIQAKLFEFEERLPSRGYEAPRLAVKKWTSYISQSLANGIWKDVSSNIHGLNSMVMLRRNGYREFFECMLLFELGLLLGTGVGEFDSSGNVKPVYDLYELWCYFQLRRALEIVCGEEGEPSLKHIFRDEGYFVDLKRNTESSVSFSYKNLTLKFYYVRQFRSPPDDDSVWNESYSTYFKPDFTIQVEKSGEVLCLHFDAKYRLNKKDWKRQFVISDEDGNNSSPVSYKRKDLHVMHAYRDAIISAIGSYILYPGVDDSDIFVRHKTKNERESMNIPSVGAFPLKPNADFESQIGTLVAFLRTVLDEIEEG